MRPFPAAELPGPGVDSNGAGDAFIAGFLFGYLAGKPLDACCRLGAIAGAQACTVPSTRAEPITKAELLKRAAGSSSSGSK